MKFVEIKGKGIKLTDANVEYARKKVESLSKFLRNFNSDTVEVRIEIGKDKHHRKGDVFYAEVNLKLPDKLIRAVSEHENMFYAITDTKDKLQEEIKDYVGILRGKIRKQKGHKELE